MVNESLKRRIQKLESESNRQRITIADIYSTLASISSRLRKIEKAIEEAWP